jgi:hypothetical protein
VPSGARPSDLISLGVLATSVPRETVDEAIAATGKQAKRSDGMLPPHVMVYFVMALALYADEDYEEVATLLTEALQGWGSWGRDPDPDPHSSSRRHRGAWIAWLPMSESGSAMRGRLAPKS